MRKVIFGVMAILTTIAISLSATGAQPFDAAEGGGQVVLSGEDPTRAGNTIAFSVQATSARVAGSVQYLETSLAGGEDPARVPGWHGVPACLRVDGGTAEIGGSIASGTSDAGFFALLVTDNGTPAEGLDEILIQYPDSKPDCMADWSNVAELSLARGNVTVNDAG